MDARDARKMSGHIVLSPHICYIKVKVKIVFYIVAAALFVIGLIFIIAGSYPLMPGRLIVGSILLLGAAALIIASRLQPQVREMKVSQTFEVAGDVSLEKLTCRSCGGALGKENISLKDGALFVECPFCSTTYQMEEDPKW
jgi:hypothetical protein